jgi:hypothetical protein
VELAWFAKPTLCSARKIQSPLRSPVNIRPVRFPPWAAGAKPTINRSASKSPKTGTGFAQYSQSEYAFFLAAPMASRHSTSLGHSLHPTICSFRSLIRELWELWSDRKDRAALAQRL